MKFKYLPLVLVVIVLIVSACAPAVPPPPITGHWQYERNPEELLFPDDQGKVLIIREGSPDDKAHYVKLTVKDDGTLDVENSGATCKDHDLTAVCRFARSNFTAVFIKDAPAPTIEGAPTAQHPFAGTEAAPAGGEAAVNTTVPMVEFGTPTASPVPPTPANVAAAPGPVVVTFGIIDADIFSRTANPVVGKEYTFTLTGPVDYCNVSDSTERWPHPQMKPGAVTFTFSVVGYHQFGVDCFKDGEWIVNAPITYTVDS